MPNVPTHVGEGDYAGPALDGIHPVAFPGIADQVRRTAKPDPQTVSAVKKNWEPDKNGFERDHHRQTAEEANLARVGARPVDCSRVGDEDVFDQERADRDNASD